MAAAESTMLSVLRQPTPFSTPELEALIALVQAVKGHDDYTSTARVLVDG